MNAPFAICVDTREQAPWVFPPEVHTAPATLSAGDYSLSGFEDLVAIERKSLADLVACIGPERERFVRELIRLRGYRCRAVVVEATLQAILSHGYRSMTTPASVVGSLASWQVKHEIPVVFAGDAAGAAVYALAILRNYHRSLVEFAAKLQPRLAG